MRILYRCEDRNLPAHESTISFNPAFTKRHQPAKNFRDTRFCLAFQNVPWARTSCPSENSIGSASHLWVCLNLLTSLHFWVGTITCSSLACFCDISRVDRQYIYTWETQEISDGTVWGQERSRWEIVVRIQRSSYSRTANLWGQTSSKHLHCLSPSRQSTSFSPAKWQWTSEHITGRGSFPINSDAASEITQQNAHSRWFTTSSGDWKLYLVYWPVH